MRPLQDIISECKTVSFDLDFNEVKSWKSGGDNRVVVGHMPVYFPREIVHAANGMAAGIMGAGDIKQIIKGDAYYQSYICHMPRGIIELALDGNLDVFDGFVFPAICDVMRNLSGMFQILKKGRFSKYMDFPQNFKNEIGGTFYKSEMTHILKLIEEINGVKPTTEQLNKSIGLFNKNRRLLNRIYDIRQDYPWRMSMADVYCVTRAGLCLPVEKHNEILEDVLHHIEQEIGKPEDKIRVIVSGAFCEQPPLGLIVTIENAGCFVVDDDFLIGSRWIQEDIADDTDDPLTAIAEAYLKHSVFSSTKYDVDDKKEEKLVELMDQRSADGIILAGPSFCDPALLDRPVLQKACDDRGIRYIAFQYNENTGQFKVVKEQVGAFSDSIKLWEEEPVLAS